MADILVDIEGMGPVAFPDTMSQAEINAAATKAYEDNQAAQSSSAISDITNMVRTYAEPAFELVKKAALPVVGGAIGSIAGTAVGGPVGGMAGMSLGSGLGEVANQGLGITEKSEGEVLGALAMPAVAGVAMSGLKMVGGSLLKAFGGRAQIAEIAGDVGRRLYSPKVSADELFTRALRQSGSMPMPNAAQAIDDVLVKEAGNLPTETSSAIKAALSPLLSHVQPQPAQMGPSSLVNQYGQPIMQQVKAATTGKHDIGAIDAATKDLRLQASLAYKSQNSRMGHALSNIRNAIFDDAAASGNPLLREAATAARREHAVEELAGVLRQAQPLKAFQDLQTKNKLFQGAFNDTEKEAIEKMMTRLSTAAPSGFSGVLGRSITTAAGGSVAGIPGAIAGGLVPDAAAYALSTAPGRRFMGNLLEKGALTTSPGWATVLTWARAHRAQDAQAGDVADRVSAVLKAPSISLDDKITAAQERHNIIKAGKNQEAVSY